ncbi:MAG: beta-glucosidase BglX [Ruminococcaceae bacterium]|nr:beta-glucosidase BglX [Oscillospiraceae bacterium]
MAKSNFDINKLLSQMTLEEKVGQLIQLNSMFIGETTADITGPKEQLGVSDSMLAKIGSTLNFHSFAEVKALQDGHMEKDRLGIPLLFMMDVIHGYRTIFPIPLALGASFDPELVKDCTRMAAKEASAGGIHVTFTPMVDYVRDARWGRVMETCGEDPLVNSVMGAAQVEAFQGDDISDPENIATCVKHFAAYGGAEAGRDYNTVELSERLLRECYFPAYKACLDAGANMVMPSFNSLNGVPSIANKWLIQDVLKGEWGFDGIIISDYNAIGELLKHGIAQNAKDAALMAFENGCDIDMMSAGYCSSLCQLVEEGKVSEKKIDEAVLKVLELKRELGLFEDPYHGGSTEKEEALCLCPEHRAIALRAAEECAVLLKNNGTLPFSKDIKNIAIIGPFADSNAIKGFWACNGLDKECVSVAEGVKNLLPDAKITVAAGCSAEWNVCDKDGFAEAVEAARNADAVILCLGEPQNYSGEGNSRADLGLPGEQMALAREVLAVNKNAAAVLFNGRPLVLTELDEIAPAILDMFFPGSEGGNAAARLLFGEANPSGKVTMSFPKSVGQCPIYYNHPSTGRPKARPENVHQPYASSYIGCGNKALYPFGHGLSYSDFSYESLELDTDRMSADSEINVRVTVKNNGDRAGKEVVQLYMRDLCASAVRPVQSLIAFKKVDIGAGETVTVDFTITEEMLRFYNFRCEFISEPGDFEVSAGYADNLILTKKFTLE